MAETCNINEPFWGMGAVQRIPDGVDRPCVAPCSDNGEVQIGLVNQSFHGMCFYKNDEDEESAAQTLEECVKKYPTCVVTRDGVFDWQYHTFYSKYPCWQNCNTKADEKSCLDGPIDQLTEEQTCDFDQDLIDELSKPNPNWDPEGKKCNHCGCDVAAQNPCPGNPPLDTAKAKANDSSLFLNGNKQKLARPPPSH